MKKRRAMRLEFEPERLKRRRVLLNGVHTAWKARRGRDGKGRRVWELVQDVPGDPPTEGKVWCTSPEARALLGWLRAVLSKARERAAAMSPEDSGAVAAREVVERGG